MHIHDIKLPKRKNRTNRAGQNEKRQVGEMEQCVQRKIHTCMKMSSCNTVPCMMNIHNGKQI